MLSSREAAATNSPDIVGSPYRGQYVLTGDVEDVSNLHLETERADRR